MFTEAPSITERYRLAKEAGFKAVESGFPFGYSVKDVSEARKKADIEQILINVYTGDVTKGELGFAAVPGQEENFKKKYWYHYRIFKSFKLFADSYNVRKSKSNKYY